MALLPLFAVAAMVVTAGSAGVRKSLLQAPAPVTPRAGLTVQALPAFGWRGVGDANHYEFQIGADPSFNSPVVGHGHDSISTRNTWASVTEAVPNGTYWWHVRAVTKTGGVSGWSAPHVIRKQWTSAPRLLSPSNRAEMRFPSNPLVLRWAPVPYAAKYLVSLATDSNLGTLLGRKPIETEGLSFAPSITLANGTYYWAVTPMDAQGNRGERSSVASFRWAWHSETKASVHDLVAVPEHFDPQLSWTPVPGAARYEVEVNPSHEWAVGSKVCCNDPVLTTTLSPTQLLGNNKYFWRVRAINVDGNAGGWNEGPSFTKSFDNVDVEGARPPLLGQSIKNAHMRDDFGDGQKPAGWTTNAPVAVWDPVPGASGYQVDVVPYGTPDRSDCDWVARRRTDIWHVDTAVPSWTPQSFMKVPNDREPYPARNIHAAYDPTKALIAGQRYCIRVRARTDRDLQHQDVFGDYTYFPEPAFTFGGYATGGSAGNAHADTYGAPVNKVRVTRTPLFSWRPVSGAASYWVIVAKDASFTNVVDYALTNIPAYSPRRFDNPVTYSDEETLYYWAVLPATRFDGAGAPGDPLSQVPQRFEKRSVSPALLLPKQGALVVGPPTFRWTAVEGAKRYRLQVSQDPNFGTLLDEILTNSTAYTATKTYPANAALHVQVRAEDENDVGLSWSVEAKSNKARTFRNTLARPVQTGDNLSRSDFIPTWSWNFIPGALSYDLHVELPDGTTRDFPNMLPTAFTPIRMTGTGVFHWQVRAEFPQARGGKTAQGPYSARMAFTRTIAPPSGTHAIGGAGSVLLSWQPKTGAEHYRIEISRAPDFSRTLEREDTEGTTFAPDLRSRDWSNGGAFYWRVTAVDASGNTGNSTPVQAFRLSASRSK
jgi:hypothetical protein